MDPLFEASAFTGYVYPNETVIPWSVLIVVYPYLTGLVAGSFTVSSLYHVFHMQQFKPVARFAMLLALCLMLCVPMPLLLHLGHPERAFNAMIKACINVHFGMAEICRRARAHTRQHDACVNPRGQTGPQVALHCDPAIRSRNAPKSILAKQAGCA